MVFREFMFTKRPLLQRISEYTLITDADNIKKFLGLGLKVTTERNF